MSANSHTVLKVGLFGAGVVGGGVLDLVQRYTSNGKFQAYGISVEVAKICVQSLDKARDVLPSDGIVVTTDHNEILNDPTINCVIELIGGTTAARDVVISAISKGKHVITANKALIANYLPEIEAALVANPNVRFSYEAAVCGGIPVINALQTDFVADEITSIMGIMNGTTNFMLSKMEDEGADYGVVLQEAQRLGFAEADPTADVEGHDVQAKIALLAKLAFGKTISVPSVPTTGISTITAVDFEYAKILRSTIKLLGTAVVAEKDDCSKALSVFVSPTMVPLSSPLASAKGPGNMVLINSANMGASTLAGPGAGRYPTANSVLNDIVRLAQNRTSAPFPLKDNATLTMDNNFKSKFYVRIKCADELGIVRTVGTTAEANRLSIHSILQQPAVPHASTMNFVVITDLVSLSCVQGFAADIAKASFTKATPVYMPIL